MKTVKELAQCLKLSILCGEAALQREVQQVYCCDLLSFVMGQAPAGGVWVTVMGNVNTAAVAQLTDVACVVLACGVQPDANALQKARINDIAILQSRQPIFETALALHQVLTQ